MVVLLLGHGLVSYWWVVNTAHFFVTCLKDFTASRNLCWANRLKSDAVISCSTVIISLSFGVISMLNLTPKTRFRSSQTTLQWYIQYDWQRFDPYAYEKAATFSVYCGSQTYFWAQLPWISIFQVAVPKYVWKRSNPETRLHLCSSRQVPMLVHHLCAFLWSLICPDIECAWLFAFAWSHCDVFENGSHIFFVYADSMAWCIQGWSTCNKTWRCYCWDRQGGE